MCAFQSSYVGRHDFPTRLGDFKLRQWFTFDVRDRRSIRKALRSRYWTVLIPVEGRAIVNATQCRRHLSMNRKTLKSPESLP
jgi:hypothetical protein